MLDQFAQPSKTIKEAVAGLIAPADTDIDKAKKLYAAVQALDNTDYSRKKTASEIKELKIKETRHAEDNWSQKAGPATTSRCCTCRCCAPLDSRHTPSEWSTGAAASSIRWISGRTT